MFENLKTSVSRAIKNLKGQGKITEINVAAAIKEIRRALVKADVNYKIAKEVTDSIRQKALGREVLTAVSPGQLLTKIVSEELALLMGGEKVAINLEGNPAVVMVIGLQGSGKTTFSGKLAARLKEQYQEVLLIACDVYRPAAIEQLKVVGEGIDVEVYAEPDNKDVLQIAQHGIAYAKTHNKRVVIIDTAGRLAIDEVMMEEVIALKAAIHPSSTVSFFNNLPIPGSIPTISLRLPIFSICFI